MEPKSFVTTACRIACLLVAAYLALRGIAWLSPKVSDAARHLLGRV